MKHGDYEYKNLKEDDQDAPDKELLQDYVHATMEMRQLTKRFQLLQRFTEKNQDKCERYIWKNQLGQMVAITDIDDAYLINLTKYLARSVRSSYDDAIQEKLEALAAELEKRGLKIAGVDLLESGK